MFKRFEVGDDFWNCLILQVSKIGVEGVVLDEVKNINKLFFVFGNVIVVLVDGNVSNFKEYQLFIICLKYEIYIEIKSYYSLYI